MAYEYALLSMEESQRAIKQADASEPRLNDINDALDAASQQIQDYLERVVIRASWIEYHQMCTYQPSILRIKHWPISAVTEIAEDSARSYGASSVLTVDTDYQIIEEGEHTSIIRRISGDTPTTWLSGFEAIRVTFSGGWLPADVPPVIRRVCREYLARQYHAAMNQDYAFQSVSDARGDVTHFGPVMLTKPQKEALSEYKDHGATTCVRFTAGS